MTDTSLKPDRHLPEYTQADWDEVSDNPELTEAETAALRPASEVPEVFALLPKRGRPKRADAKVNLTLRIDPALLAAYRATGDGWQVKMHEALVAYLPDAEVFKAPAKRPSGPVFISKTKRSPVLENSAAKRSSISGQFVAVHARQAAAPRKPKAKPKTA